MCSLISGIFLSNPGWCWSPWWDHSERSMVGSSNIEAQHKLVGGIPTPLKHISQMGVLFPIYGKIKAMFQTTNQLRVQRFCLPPDNITSTILIFMDKSLWFTVIYMLPPRWSGWSLPNMGTVRTGKMVRKSWILWAAHFQIRIWKIRYLSLDRCRVHPDHAAVEPSLNHGAWWVQHDVVALWPAK